MSNVIGYLAQIFHDIQLLKGLMSRLLAASSIAGTSLPVVDFCCDMFDRTDSAVLNGYWSDATGSWALRNHRAIYQGLDAGVALGSYSVSSVTVISSSVSGFPNSTGTTPAYVAVLTGGVISGNQRPNLYQAKISTTDFQVKATFDALAPVTGGVTSNTVVTLVNPTSPITATTTTQALSSYPANCGLVIGSATPGRNLGVSCNGFLAPQIDAPTFNGSANISGVLAESITSPAITIPSGISLNGTFGLLTNSVAGAAQAFQSGVSLPASAAVAFTPLSFTTTPDPNVINGTQSRSFTLAGIDSFTTNPAAPPLVAGTNTLLLQATGDTYSVYLNGVLWYTVTQVLMTDRAQPGLMATAANLMGYISTQLGLAFYGVSSFKAWPIGQAEPPDQTGRGTYAGGYNDKYHDADGNYNPLA